MTEVHKVVEKRAKDPKLTHREHVANPFIVFRILPTPRARRAFSNLKQSSPDSDGWGRSGWLVGSYLSQAMVGVAPRFFLRLRADIRQLVIYFR